MRTIDTMIIPAAGYGTRMLTFTKGSSKELLEVGGKPALLYALMEAMEAGISRVGIVVRDGKEDILEAVNSDSRLFSIRKSMHISFFNQLKHTGEAGAICTAIDWIGDAPFVVHYPDNIITGKTGVLSQLIQKQAQVGTEMVLLTPMLEFSQTPACGLDVLGKNLYLVKPDEAPSFYPYGLRPTGIYVALPGFLQASKELLDHDGTTEIKDRDVRCLMLQRGYTIHGLDCYCPVLDVGNPDGYRNANEILKKRLRP